LVVNLIAIAVYFDLARSDRRGFKRLLAFWIGFPMTFFVKLFVPPDPDLVMERRLDAMLPSEEADIGVPEYVREEIRAIRQERIRGSTEATGRKDSPPPGTRPADPEPDR
jgi:hypothetical protein